jgi:glycosyltransferase involved in cell wall biosynthesis
MKLVVISHACATPANQDLFARVQRATGWETTLVLPREWKTEWGERRTASLLPGFHADLRPLPVGLNGNIPLHFYRASLSRLFRDLEPDVIFCQHESYALATMQAFAANRRATQVPIAFKNDQNIAKRYPWLIRLGERFVYRNAAFALASAPPAADALRQKGYMGPLKVVPYGVDMSHYRPVEVDRRTGVPLVIGYVGRLVPEKGIDILLRAISDAPGTRCLIVGTGPSERELRALANSLGIADRIEWRGYVEHDSMPAVYPEMDLLVLPSRTTPNWREQFGRVVIEALSCGVPVMSSDSGEPPALIEATGGGWTFAEERAEQLAELLRWADHHREELRQRGDVGRAKARELFSADAVAASFIAAIRRYALDQSRDAATEARTTV